MADIAKHPKYDQAASSSKRRLEESIDADQQSALAQLSVVRAALVSLAADNILPLGKDVIDEVADLTKVIESVDPKSIDDGAIALLHLVEVRLSRLAARVRAHARPQERDPICRSDLA